MIAGGTIAFTHSIPIARGPMIKSLSLYESSLYGKRNGTSVTKGNTKVSAYWDKIQEKVRFGLESYRCFNR